MKDYGVPEWYRVKSLNVNDFLYVLRTLPSVSFALLVLFFCFPLSLTLVQSFVSVSLHSQMFAEQNSKKMLVTHSSLFFRVRIFRVFFHLISYRSAKLVCTSDNDKWESCANVSSQIAFYLIVKTLVSSLAISCSVCATLRPSMEMKNSSEDLIFVSASQWHDVYAWAIRCSDYTCVFWGTSKLCEWIPSTQPLCAI